VVKSNRRRKQERSKRLTAAAQRRAAGARRRLREQAIREAEQRMAVLRDPRTSVETVAAAIRDQYDGEPVMPGLPLLLLEYRGSVDEVVGVGEALLAAEGRDGGQPSLSALTFGAGAAHLAGDHQRARRLMDQALARAGDVETRLRLAAHLRILGRPADAIGLLAAHVADPAYGPAAATTHGGALEDAQRRAGDGAQGACPCGSGTAWSACCRPREAGAVERFLDRSGLYALRTALAEYLPGSAYEKAVDVHVVEWLDIADAGSWEPGEIEPLERMAIEHAWIAAGTASLDDDGDVEDEDRDNLLTAFAADPATPRELAARAEVWREHVRYGLWQVETSVPSPGLWCTDLGTGQELYLAFAPEQVERVPRWGVLLGAVVPLDGAWRATGSMIQLSPSEADALCETIQAATEALVGELAGRPNKRALEQLRRPSPFGRAEPHNVYAYEQDPASPEAAVLIGRIVGSLLPRLVGELHAWRATPPSLANTDGEPLCQIKARIAVRDAAGVAARLAAHADFDTDSEDASRLSWLGREVPAAQRKAMFAEARAQLRAQGHTDADLEVPDGPNRWVRGRLQFHGSEVTVDVNSRERLARLLTILDEVGAEPTVVDESRVDPAQDLPWPAGHRPFGGGLAPPGEGWERQWLDESVPALRGRTPRQAAGSAEEPLLEGMLRELEYDADLLAQAGKSGADVAWLREQLGMPADQWA